MNKEQLKEAIEGHVVRADDCMMNQNVIPLEVIKVLIDQLEEPEIVEFPEWIVDILKDTNDEEYNRNFKRPYIKLDYIVFGKLSPTDLDTTQEKFLKYIHSEELDIDEAIKKVMYAIVTGNYIIKKEPKYYIRVGTLLFQGFDNTIARFVVDDSPGSLEEAQHYSDREVAEHEARIISGEVEEVESE